MFFSDPILEWGFKEWQVFIFQVQNVWKIYQDVWFSFVLWNTRSKYWSIKQFCYILPNPDIPFLSKESGIRNNSYSVKGIGTQGSKILYSYSFPKSLILLAFIYNMKVVAKKMFTPGCALLNNDDDDEDDDK